MAIRSHIQRTGIDYFPSPKGNAKGPQQLALFNMKPNNRWRRGYTPERKAEIEAAMPEVFIGGGEVDKPVQGEGWAGDATAIFRTKDDRGAVAPTEGTILNIQRTRARNTIARSLARSKVSPEDLSNVEAIVINDDDTEMASFNAQYNEMRLKQTGTNDNREMLLLHEIGHANDPKFPEVSKYHIGEEVIDKRGRSRKVDIESEGFAEGYGQSKYVPRNLQPKQFSRGYDNLVSGETLVPLKEHTDYKRGVLRGSGGTVSIDEEEKNKPTEHPTKKPDWEQLSFDI